MSTQSKAIFDGAKEVAIRVTDKDGQAMIYKFKNPSGVLGHVEASWNVETQDTYFDSFAPYRTDVIGRSFKLDVKY
jgi:hypothetical protein